MMNVLKRFSCVDHLLVLIVVIVVSVVIGDAAETSCSGSWCVYEGFKARLDNAEKSNDSTSLICVDIERAISTSSMKNPRAIEALRLLAAKCWAKSFDFENAANVLVPIRNNSNKIFRMWFEMEKSYLDSQTRFCRENLALCDTDKKRSLADRYRILLKYNEDLGLPYEKQIKYGIMVNR